ncbi:MAG: amidase [Deltaproteobacteria bacterium]|nr:amidase [Deltaproteobacteria bacterium]MBW2394090.1 amidase [Deltaproteobacteria bacterium]
MTLPDSAHWLSALEVGTAIGRGEFSSSEVTQSMLARIEELNPVYRPYNLVLVERALAQAQKLDDELRAGNSRGPLHGVPIGIKDLCDIEGEPTFAGTQFLGKLGNATETSCVVERLEAAGAVILGKLKLTEGAFTSHHPSVEPPINPWCEERWTGISSSGSGVATAAGLAFATLGSDTGGSIRLPSASCGLTGLKPTHGRVPLHGVFPLSTSLDHVGPMTRNVADCAAIFDVIAGGDARDPQSLWSRAPRDEGASAQPPAANARGVRMGVDRRAFEEGDEKMAGLVIAALDVFRELGAEIIELELPDMAPTAAAWPLICAADVANAHAATFPSRADEYGPDLRGLLEVGNSVSGRALAEANAVRDVYAISFDRLFDEVSAVLTPVIPVPLPAGTNLGGGELSPEQGLLVMRFNLPVDMARTPALTMPCGFTGDGGPVGFQLVARRLHEARLLELGAAYQGATDWHEAHPRIG